MSSAARLIAASMPEDRGPDSLEAHLRKLLADFGLSGYHPRDSRGSQKGWVDWVILGGHRALFRELKSEHGTVTPEQRDVGAMLRQAGLDYAVWRPRDLLSGRIARELADVASIQAAMF